jgi:hypothetical protein
MIGESHDRRTEYFALRRADTELLKQVLAVLQKEGRGRDGHC